MDQQLAKFVVQGMKIELEYIYLCPDGHWRQCNEAFKNEIQSRKKDKTEFKYNPFYYT